MQPIATSTRTLEFAPPCKQLAAILIGVYALSFALTWYRVWWDSLIGLAVAGFGFYTLRNANVQQLNIAHVGYFYKASIVSMVSHVVALAVVLYYMLQGHLANDVLGWGAVKIATPGWVFFGFLLAMLGAEITLTAYSIASCFSLQAEIDRNLVLTELTRGQLHA